MLATLSSYVAAQSAFFIIGQMDGSGDMASAHAAQPLADQRLVLFVEVDKQVLHDTAPKRLTI
jgi:hypothetical protein